MSGRGGIYKGPNGELLHGDGKPMRSAEPVVHGEERPYECDCGADSDIHADDCPVYALGGPYAPLPPAFGSCDRCGGVLIQEQSGGKSPRLRGLSDAEYEAAREALARPALPAPEPPREPMHSSANMAWCLEKPSP